MTSRAEQERCTLSRQRDTLIYNFIKSVDEKQECSWEEQSAWDTPGAEVHRRDRYYCRKVTRVLTEQHESMS